jgi:hypothetical protein
VHLQFPSAPGVQVDLIPGTVQSEADGTFGGAAVEIIDEQGSVIFWATAARVLSLVFSALVYAV